MYTYGLIAPFALSAFSSGCAHAGAAQSASAALNRIPFAFDIE
jgi:hypothetical protein